MATRAAGEGPVDVLCLHEAAATGLIWGPLADVLSGRARVIAPDRPGWGEAPTPEGYARTTVGEQAAFAAAILEEQAGGPAVICGAGIGAVAALEVTMRRPELVLGSVLIEPPLLALVPAATEQLSADAEALREAVEAGGREAALDLYLSGGLPALGGGAGGIPEGLRARGPAAATSLFAELAAVPAWALSASGLASALLPSVIVTGTDTSPVLLEAASELTALLTRSERREVGGGSPHYEHPAEVAEIVLEVRDYGPAA